jgi:gliding motility-associated-like protein
MKKIIIFLVVILAGKISAQSNADCINNIPLCSTPSFTFFAGQGIGNVDELPNSNNISNPPANPNPPNSGCLLTGENKPQWLLITVGNSGFLEFVFGAGNSPNPQVGYYDWAMWPYSPTACADIENNILPPIRCNWNATSVGGTGIASATNIPNGGNPGNYEAPLAVNACQQFIICISNYSGVNTLVSFQSLGTASLSCNPNCNPSYSICAGSQVTVTASNFQNLTNASYSMNPGAVSNPSGTFVVTPLVTTSYTTYVTGTNQANIVVTTTGVTNVTVNPTPNVSPTFTQATCSNSVNAVNLNLGFNPAPTNYTVVWSPVPPSVVSPTQTSATGLAAGVTNVTVMTASGCSTTVSFTMSPAPSIANFTITPPGATFSLTCTNTLITLNTAPLNYTYMWTSLSNTIGGAVANFTPGMQGTYTVVASNGIAGCSTTQTVTIGQNTVAPTNSVNPASQAITCNSGAPVTFTGICTNPTVNIQHDWYSPLNPYPAGVPIATSNNSTTILNVGLVGPCGTFALVTTDLVNGCKTIKTITVTSLEAWPTFSMASTTNFSLGCNPINCSTLSIINPVSTQTPIAATCSYTFLAPSFTGVVTPSVQLGNSTATVVCTPGTWTVIVQDNSNFCRSILPISVLQNTVPPHVLATMLTTTLMCFNPTVLATGTSTTPNTNVNWLVPSIPSLYSQPTVVIGDPANGPPTSTTSLFYANFTVVATNSMNACVSTSVIPIYQNFKNPISSPTISIATPTAIYCVANTAPVVLTTGNSTTTSGGGPTSFVANPCWSGPSPQTSTCGPSSYSCYVPGIYSLQIMDAYNGCTHTGTVNVLDRTQPPVVTNSFATAVLDCGSSQATLALAMTGTMTGGARYWVLRFPVNAAFNPTNAISYDINPILAGTTSSLIMVDKVGEYVYVVTNTLTGCKAQGTVNVVNGALTPSFTPSPESGYAPLDVNFINNSLSTTGAGSITSIWSFGNGTSATNTNNASQNTSYSAPGNYSVMLVTKKGVCVDSILKVIRVDIPSKMEVPNIFTPNGDGSNDVFFLKAANLTELNCVILDRWGNKVYETSSGTGNVAWDGKNFGGKECAAGVYFYIIKAKGKDDKTFESKGNVTLIR